jgi:uncharacterized protein YbjT (DUF2867 family)
LLNAGVVLRQGLRNPEEAGAGMDAVRFDYTESTTLAPALNEMRGLVIAPPLDATAPAKLGPVITAAKNLGVEHIVLISAFGVNHNEHAPLRIVEHLLIDCGVPYTILRPNFFMENFSQGSVPETIKGLQRCSCGSRGQRHVRCRNRHRAKTNRLKTFAGLVANEWQ